LIVCRLVIAERGQHQARYLRHQGADLPTHDYPVTVWQSNVEHGHIRGPFISECRPRARPVQVRASHRIPVFDVAQRNVAPVAKQSSHALAARPVLRPAALAAHRACVVLELQQQIEVLLRQPVAGYPVLPVGILAGLGRLGMRVGAPVRLPLAMLAIAMQGGAWPGLRAHVVCFRGIHLPTILRPRVKNSLGQTFEN
jgi:hypothetical protein